MDFEEMAALRREMEGQHKDELKARLNGLFASLAEVISGADRSLGAEPVDSAGMQDALGAVRGQLANLLRRHDVELVGAVGEPIDADRHAVVDIVEDKNSGQPLVARIVCFGISITDDGVACILRKAEVVSTRPESEGTTK